jgi:multisubunit Na+/H+ antiporter MnhG subunit
MTATTPTMVDGLPSGQPAASRFGRLSVAVRQMRTRAAGARLDRWLLIVGGVLMPLGVLLIILGWVGASRTPLPFEQNDYLISGGILGLGLVIAGGFVYFAYWQTIRIRESRTQTDQLLTALGRLERLMTAQLGEEAAASAGQLVATPSGSIFHRPDCTIVLGRNDLRAVDPGHTKLEACRLCNPLDGRTS